MLSSRHLCRQIALYHSVERDTSRVCRAVWAGSLKADIHHTTEGARNYGYGSRSPAGRKGYFDPNLLSSPNVSCAVVRSKRRTPPLPTEKTHSPCSCAERINVVAYVAEEDHCMNNTYTCGFPVPLCVCSVVYSRLINAPHQPSTRWLSGCGYG